MNLVPSVDILCNLLFLSLNIKENVWSPASLSLSEANIFQNLSLLRILISNLIVVKVLFTFCNYTAKTRTFHFIFFFFLQITLNHFCLTLLCIKLLQFFLLFSQILKKKKEKVYTKNLCVGKENDKHKKMFCYLVINPSTFG